ncbi:MAG: PD40 domain-containing protein [Acidobacteria bacterium]|nr:PD40 domain-containing protein [Acidobacteriota bacterium]
MGTDNFRYYEFDDYQIDVRRRILLKKGERVALSSRIFDLLLVLVQNEGRILEHDELLEMVWEGMFVEQSNLKKSVSALRQALGEQPNESIYIKTVPRRGYSFVADVRALPDAANDSVIVKQTREEIIVEEEYFDEPDHREIVVSPIRRELAAPPPENQKRRARWPLVAGGVCAVVLLAAFGLWMLARGRALAGEFRPDNLRPQKLTTTGNILQATISPDGKTVIYAASDGSGRQSLWLKRIGQTNALQLVPPSDLQYNAIVVSPDNNSIYYAVTEKNALDVLYRVPISGGAARKIVENIRSTPTFSPDGKKFAFVRDTPDKMRRLLIVNAEDGGGEQEIYSVSDNHKLIEPRWSPDGGKFAFVASDVTEKGRVWGLQEIPAPGGPIRQILAPQVGKVYAPAWLKDGSGLLFPAEPTGTRQRQLWRVDYRSGEVTRLTNDVSSYEDVVLSADNSALVSIQSDTNGDLWSLNWNPPQTASKITETRNFIGFLTGLPDGRLLAEYVENGSNGLEYLSTDGGNLSPMFEQPNGERSPSLTADGKSLLFISRRSGTQEIWKSDLDGRDPRRLTDDKTFVLCPRQTPDGREIFFLRYDGARWRLVKMPAAGGDVVHLVNEVAGVYSLSPDGKQYAFSYLNEEKKRWLVALRNTADNSTVREFEIDPISYLDWTPDGKSLIYNASEASREGGSLWVQPLDGTAPKLVFEAKDDPVYYGAWSADKQKLFLSRGKTIQNIVLMTRGGE